MPKARLNAEIRTAQGIDVDESVKQINLALGEIYSGKNLGLNARYFDADATLDNSDALCIITTSGVDLTLPAVNAFSTILVNKTPMIIVLSLVNTSTIVRAGTDTIGLLGATSYALNSGELLFLFADVTNTRWILTSRSLLFGTGGIDSITAATAAINTTETIVVGGAGSGTRAYIPANTLKAGAVVRITLEGTCTNISYCHN